MAANSRDVEHDLESVMLLNIDFCILHALHILFSHVPLLTWTEVRL